jgi:hypothetical protein
MNGFNGQYKLKKMATQPADTINGYSHVQAQLGIQDLIVQFEK